MKKILRQRFLKRRKAMTSEEIREKSTRISRTLFEYLPYRQCSTVLLYASCGGEVSTDAILDRILSDGKVAAYPVVDGKTMHFSRITGKEDLKCGYKGILEPAMYCEILESFDEDSTLMLVPGVVFDKDGGRIGQGGGFYDRYLEGHPGVHTAAVAYDWQVMNEHLPLESYDHTVSAVITENEIYTNGHSLKGDHTYQKKENRS